MFSLCHGISHLALCSLLGCFLLFFLLLFFPSYSATPLSISSSLLPHLHFPLFFLFHCPMVCLSSFFLSIFLFFPHFSFSLPALHSLNRCLFLALSLSSFLPPLHFPLSLRLFRRFFEGRSRGRQCKHRPSE